VPRNRGASSAPTAGVLITVGAGVAVLMALWPLMVAFSSVAAIGLLTVAALASGVLVVAVVQVATGRGKPANRSGQALARSRPDRLPR